MRISFSGLSKSYEGKTIFDNLNGQINNGDKIGLIGSNGVGKTTLVKLLTGNEEKDSGDIMFSGDIKILYIQQYPEFDEECSVLEDILNFICSWNKDKWKDEKTEGQEALAKKALSKVGLSEELWNQKASSLSGGEKTKLALSRMLVCDFDFLILDEPTNHLDMVGHEWLEEFIKNLDKPMLVISHDRYFLDNTANKIWELTKKELKVYEGNYSSYKLQKEIEEKNILKEYEKQQTRIQELKAMISDRENWYHRAHKAAGQNDYLRARAKKQANTLNAKKTQLERLERDRIEKPQKEVSPAFDVINKNIIGRKFPRFLIQGKDISKSYGENQVLSSISFNVERGDRIAVIGANGSGKSTLLKTICGIFDDYTGSLNISPTVKIGYFSQELENLNQNAAILDDVMVEGVTYQEARLLLASLLFRGDDVYKKIGHLSMGEKGRVAFAKLILSGANLLVLDEPTNYMDIKSKEKIEEALEQFQGSMIFVSHDRYFINRLASRIFLIENKKLHIFDGNYEYYLAKCRKKADDEKDNHEKSAAESIMKLELELAYLGGKLDVAKDESEKEELNKRYLEVARKLNQLKQQS
ncbi:MAG: ABC-F type ribosomal protection protein [Clostridiaceae bacterium]|nr:ABC-F type ribosomal protection protein [Clostridiaceae bacterium]